MAIALNIPSQIEKYLSVALFPATGNEFTLYITNDTNRLYQWNGAAYVEVSQQDAVNWGSIGGDIINQTDLQLALAGKVDVEAGKGLSTNDYTTAEKNKLAGIEAGAQVNDVDSVNGYTGAVVLNKSDVGLSNVDNTSDLNKPISTATQSALNAKENTITAGTTSQYFRGDKTFQTLDKAAVGLGNVDNTSDANKPISTATQAALNAKQDTLVSGTNIKTINGSSILGSGDFLTIPQLTTAQRDALTPVAGYPIYNTTEGYLETYDNFWGWMPIASQNEWMRKWGFEYWNDNVVSDAVLQASLTGTGSSFNPGSANSVANNKPGKSIFLLGTTVGSSLRVLSQSPYQLGGGRIFFECGIVAIQLSALTNRFVALVGFFGIPQSQLTSQDQTNGAYFLYDEGGVSSGSAASPNWQCVTTAGGVRTFTTTSIPYTIGQSYKMWVVINDNSSIVLFYMNETLVATHNTNVPTGASQLVGWGAGALRITGTTSAFAFWADYIGYKQKFTTPR